MSKIVNKFLAQMPTLTLKGNNTGSTANPLDLTTSQVITMLGVANNALSNLTTPTNINQALETSLGIDFNIKTKNNGAGSADNIIIQPGAGNNASNGRLRLNTSDNTLTDASEVLIKAGDSSFTTGNGGGVGITAGTTSGSGSGGGITLVGGDATSGAAGGIFLITGSSGTGAAGSISLSTGTGTATSGSITLDASANGSDINLIGTNLTVSQDPTIALGIASKQYVDARASGVFPNEIAYLKDSKSSGTAGGTFTSGAWQTRDLNTTENGQSWLSLASNQFTLDPGTYKIVASAPVHGAVDGHKLKLRNITDSTDDIIGEAEQNSTTAMTNRSSLAGIITITATKTFEIQHYCNTTKAGDGFGSATSIASINEIYTVVEIEKLLQGGVNSPVVYFKDVKSSGTAGGTFTSGSWQTRDLNTTENSQYWASLSSNQITLNAGTYKVTAAATANRVDIHQARFYNISDSSTTIIGMQDESLSTGDTAMTKSLVMGTFTISASKTFELQHRCTTTKSTNGYGYATSFGDGEVYSVVEIQKMS